MSRSDLRVAFSDHFVKLTSSRGTGLIDIDRQQSVSIPDEHSFFPLLSGKQVVALSTVLSTANYVLMFLFFFLFSIVRKYTQIYWRNVSNKLNVVEER